MAEDRTPVALFEVNMKAIFIFLFVSIVGLLAVKRSAAGKFIHFPVLLKRSEVSRLRTVRVFARLCGVL